MPRSAILKPKHREGRVSPWCVSVPPAMSPTGKRQELFFATKGEAQTECEKLKARKDNFGTSLSAMSPARIAEASEAFKLLEPFDISLLDCVRSHITILNQRKSSVTVGAAFDALAELKKNKSGKYRDEIRQARGTCGPILGLLICDVTANHLESLLPVAPAARNAKLRRLCTLFKLAIRRGWFQGVNPTERIDMADTIREEVEVFSPDDIERMLNYALEQDRGLLPFLVLATFCGIRPEGEMSRLEWADVRLNGDRPEVLVRAGTSKTAHKRAVSIAANAVAWLGTCGGDRVGKVVPFSDTTLIRKRRRMVKALGLGWIQDGPRHSFCSYWLAIHRDSEKLMFQSGHTESRTLWQHYYRGDLEDDAKQFWGIMPPETDARKVVQFASAV